MVVCPRRSLTSFKSSPVERRKLERLDRHLPGVFLKLLESIQYPLLLLSGQFLQVAPGRPEDDHLPLSHVLPPGVPALLFPRVLPCPNRPGRPARPFRLPSLPRGLEARRTLPGGARCFGGNSRPLKRRRGTTPGVLPWRSATGRRSCGRAPPLFWRTFAGCTRLLISATASRKKGVKGEYR